MFGSTRLVDGWLLSDVDNREVSDDKLDEFTEAAVAASPGKHQNSSLPSTAGNMSLSRATQT
jgi:hypothetical protein